MRILKIEFEGIKQFRRRTKVDFGGLPAIVALTGANENGKTNLLNVATLALYGKFVSAKGVRDCYEAISWGESKAYASAEFEVSGTRYLIAREFSKTGQKTHKAWVWQLGPDAAARTTKNAIKGPKVGDVAAFVEHLIGSFQLATATWFSAQGAFGDLIMATEDQRREILAEMLDFERYSRLSDWLGNRAKAARYAADAAFALLANQPDYDSLISDLEAAAQRNRAALAVAEGSIPTLEADLEAARIRKSRADAGDDADRGIIEAANAARDALDEATRAHRVLESRRRKAADLAEAAEDLRRRQEEIERITLRLESLRREERTALALASWEAMEERIQATLRQMASDLERSEEASHINRADAALANDLEQLRAKYRQALAGNKVAQDINSGRAREIDQQRTMALAKSAQIEAIKAKLRRAPKLPGTPDICGSCPLNREYADLPAQVQQLSGEIDALNREADRLEAVAPEPIVDLEELRAMGEAAAAASHRIAETKRAAEACAELRRRIEQQEAARESHRKNRPTDTVGLRAPAEISREIHECEGRLKDASEVASRLALAEQAQLDLPGIDAELLESRENIKRKEAAHAEAMLRHADATRRLQNKRAESDAARMAVSDAETALKRQRETVTRIKGDISEIVGRAKAVRESAERVAETRETAERQRKRAEGLLKLSKIFGRKGIQAILIDSAAPRLAELTDKYLGSLTDNEQSVSITTQRVLENGDIAECFGILVRSVEGEDDAIAYSGGAQQKIRLALRLACIQWIGELRGRMPEELWSDESFENLDADNVARVIGLLKGLSDTYSRIITVTHNPLIVNQLPGRIRVTRTSSGSSVALEG